ncbi:hypothetical protein K8R66_02635 [bacterium]|nr:hypothetical protein [bacterium]
MKTQIIIISVLLVIIIFLSILCITRGQKDSSWEKTNISLKENVVGLPDFVDLIVDGKASVVTMIKLEPFDKRFFDLTIVDSVSILEFVISSVIASQE